VHQITVVVHQIKKSNPSLWILLIEIQKNLDVGPKNVSHKEVLSWANFGARLPEHEKVAQRSTVALAVVREISDRRCARSPDAQIRLPGADQICLDEKTFHLQHLANLKKME
jgi:hypothetical protein